MERVTTITSEAIGQSWIMKRTCKFEIFKLVCFTQIKQPITLQLTMIDWQFTLCWYLNSICLKLINEFLPELVRANRNEIFTRDFSANRRISADSLTLEFPNRKTFSIAQPSAFPKSATGKISFRGFLTKIKKNLHIYYWLSFLLLYLMKENFK